MFSYTEVKNQLGLLPRFRDCSATLITEFHLCHPKQVLETRFIPLSEKNIIFPSLNAVAMKSVACSSSVLPACLLVHANYLAALYLPLCPWEQSWALFPFSLSISVKQRVRVRFPDMIWGLLFYYLIWLTSAVVTLLSVWDNWILNMGWPYNLKHVIEPFLGSTFPICQILKVAWSLTFYIFETHLCTFCVCILPRPGYFF